MATLNELARAEKKLDAFISKRLSARVNPFMAHLTDDELNSIAAHSGHIETPGTLAEYLMVLLSFCASHNSTDEYFKEQLAIIRQEYVAP